MEARGLNHCPARPHDTHSHYEFSDAIVSGSHPDLFEFHNIQWSCFRRSVRRSLTNKRAGQTGIEPPGIRRSSMYCFAGNALFSLDSPV
ncbi:hypothetical protein D9M72_642460 [compost metagenome]